MTEQHAPDAQRQDRDQQAPFTRPTEEQPPSNADRAAEEQDRQTNDGTELPG